jgi:hypothetical protein
MDKELELLIKHSEVFRGLYNSGELNDSAVPKEFEGISLQTIYKGEETFESHDKLIRTLNLFFKYDVDLYSQLLDFLVKKYVLKLRNNVITQRDLSYPVMEDVKKAINNTGLLTYIFIGDPSGLKPVDVFKSAELLSVSTQHFKEEEFTSEVIAEGISFFTSTKEMEGMFTLLENYPFYVKHLDLVKAAIKKDNVTLLDYLVTKHKDKRPVKRIKNIIDEFNGGTRSFNCFNYSALSGSIKCLKYSHKTGGVESDEWALIYASGNGHLDCFKYTHENGLSYTHDTRVCRFAAQNGHLDCLKYAHEQGYRWHVNICMGTAGNGHLDCLKYLHENNCPWDERTCSSAAFSGHLDCLKYLHENNCPWNEQTCSYAAMGGHLDCLKYAHEKGGASLWNQETCGWAASSGHLDCLKYAHENDCPWSSTTCNRAAVNGHLDCLKYALDNDCPWNKWTCDNAVEGGHLDCLKYLHKKGCPWYKETCLEASRFGHLDCLKYLHENGCPWDERTCIEAAENGNEDCLKYARDNGLTC